MYPSSLSVKVGFLHVSGGDPTSLVPLTSFNEFSPRKWR